MIYLNSKVGLEADSGFSTYIIILIKRVASSLVELESLQKYKKHINKSCQFKGNPHAHLN